MKSGTPVQSRSRAAVGTYFEGRPLRSRSDIVDSYANFQTMTAHRALYIEGLELFNREQFYECHDTLEELWLEDFSQDRPFYQGLIQVAVGFYHVTDGKLGAGRAMLARGLEKLKPYPGEHLGVQLEAFRQEVEKRKSRLDVLIQQQREVDFDFPKINFDLREENESNL